MDAGRDAQPFRLPDAQSTRTDAPPGLGPPYPVVLAHGFFGFDQFAGIDFVTYFHGVRDHLSSQGELQVYTPAVDPFNDSETRGAELLAHVERILAETGHEKVNLIAHSQGGLDARYVASLRPDLVASVTTIATPHRGTPVADVILELVQSDELRALADALVRVIGAPLWDAAGNETSVFASLRQFSTPGITAFNERYPDAPGVAYYSLSGRSDREPHAGPCVATRSPDFLRYWEPELDPIEPLLLVPEGIADGSGADANDGLVRVADARWGRFLGCIPADHFDEIGQLFSDSPGLGNRFDHLRFYADLVLWLRAQGH
ncbi:MAG: triacylglycerol lipase [Sandaracinaceae bacterium]|nr:triacylglycerol lipase [Sandaracinaceae bacterium]